MTAVSLLTFLNFQAEEKMACRVDLSPFSKPTQQLVSSVLIKEDDFLENQKQKQTVSGAVLS